MTQELGINPEQATDLLQTAVYLYTAIVASGIIGGGAFGWAYDNELPNFGGRLKYYGAMAGFAGTMALVAFGSL
mgnify:CR=1 FL=1